MPSLAHQFVSRRLILRSLCSILALVTVGCEAQTTTIEKDDRVEVTDANYEELVTKSSKPIVIEFHAEWCGPCKATEPAVAALSTEMPDVVFAKIDVDQAMETTMKYNVTSIPCFVFLKDGQTVGRETGGMSKSELKSLVTKYLK